MNRQVQRIFSRMNRQKRVKNGLIYRHEVPMTFGICKNLQGLQTRGFLPGAPYLCAMKQLKNNGMEKNLNSANVYNLIILDESGSMRSIYSEALTAINDAIKGNGCFAHGET